MYIYIEKREDPYYQELSLKDTAADPQRSMGPPYIGNPLQPEDLPNCHLQPLTCNSVKKHLAGQWHV